MQMLWVLGLVFISDRWLCIAITYVFNPESSLSRLIDVAELHLELALPAHFVGDIVWSSSWSSCQWLLKGAFRVLRLHQGGTGGVCDGMYLREMQVLLRITTNCLSSLLCSHGLLGFDELFGIIDRSHDVVVSGLLHHVLASASMSSSSMPPWGVNLRILRTLMHLISLIANEATLVNIFPTRALPIDWWSCLPLVGDVVAICIPGAPHCLWEFRHLFERKFEAS